MGPAGGCECYARSGHGAVIKALRHEQAVTRRIVSTAAMSHSWARHLVSDLETNPRTQYKVHLYGVIYSIYANFATDYGAMSAAMAAFGDTPPPEIPLQAGPDD
jgi:hypothetical protein